MKPVIVDALLRCTRADDLAYPLFECVQPDLNLWACELHPSFEQDADSALRSVSSCIEENLPLLYDQAVQQNSMNDAGRRINLPAEAMHLQSLSPSAGGGMEEVDRLMNAQLSAH